MDGFNRIYVESTYLVLLGPEEYNAIYNRIRYLISLKSDIAYILSDYFVKIKVILMIFLLYKKYWLCIML